MDAQRLESFMLGSPFPPGVVKVERGGARDSGRPEYFMAPSTPGGLIPRAGKKERGMLDLP